MEAEIRRNPAVFARLKKDESLYFNTRVKSEYGVLPPGLYDVSLSYFKLRSKVVRVEVKAGGWRGEFSSFLFDSICKGTLLKDFERYLAITDDMSRTEYSDESYRTIMRDLKNARESGYRKYAPKMKKRWIEGLQAEGKVDGGIARYTEALLEKKCSAQKIERARVFYIHQAFKDSVKD